MLRAAYHGVGPRWVGVLAVVSIACGTGVRLGRIPADGGDGGSPQGAVTAIDVGLSHYCAVRDGALFCAGYSLHGELIGPIAVRRIEGVDDAVEVATGHMFTCVRHADGGVSCVGGNPYGQLGRGATFDNSLTLERITGLRARSISAGFESMCAITEDDRLFCWGRNHFGQVDPSSSETAIPVPVELPGFSFQQVSLGAEHTCALTTAGTVVCFGRNGSGELGDGTGVEHRGPVEVPGLSGVTRVECANNPNLDGSTCALRADGTIACWGDHHEGVLGSGLTEPALAPLDVPGIDDASALWLGGKTAVVRRAGATAVWGHPGAMEGVVDPDTLPRVVATPLPVLDRFDTLAIHIVVACGIDAGRLYCWGVNHLQQFAGVEPGAVVPMFEPALPP